MGDPDRARVLLALADRVCAEEPSYDLSCALKQAIGHDDPLWHFRPYLTSLDAAVSAMPAGWTVHLFQTPDGDWHVQLFDPSCMLRWATMDPITEPRARTAAALRAMAVEVSNADPI